MFSGDVDLDELLAILAEDVEQEERKITYPIHKLGMPTPEVSNAIFELSRHGEVVISTWSDVKNDCLVIRARCGELIVDREVTHPSTPQEVLLVALVNLQLEV